MNWKCCKHKRSNYQAFRRIYRGDVPIITDDDMVNAPSGKTDSFALSANTAGGDSGFDIWKPKSVRRQSLSTERIKQKGSKVPEKFPSNYIVTSRYNAWNFLPKCLFEQFRRIVNFYFLFIAIIQVSIPDSPVHPAAAILPLVFVIIATLFKQGYEDWLRHKNDDVVNNRTLKVVKNGVIKETKSKDVVVGDIIRLEDNDQVPVDVLLLASSDDYLRCLINTANLDGETNLKLRYCPSGIPHFKLPMDFENLHVILECEHPNENLYDFSGSLLFPAEKLADMQWTPSDTTVTEDLSTVDGKSTCKLDHIEMLKTTALVHQGMTDFVSIPVSMDNMVLRGTRLKNTDYIYGIIVYTGPDTRLARNTAKTDAKFSTVEVRVNIYLTVFIFILIFLLIFCTAMYYEVDWFKMQWVAPWYIGRGRSKRLKSLWNTFGSYVVLLNYVIPISLYVSVEMQKVLGSKFFVWDKDMIDEEGKGPLCNTSDLNEELGQIEYLFSDKTGTLTKNLMQFRYCSIDSVRFEYTEDKLYTTDPTNQVANETAVRFEDKLYTVNPTNQAANETSSEVQVYDVGKVLRFFKVLALCHSVQVVPKRRQSFEAQDLPEVSKASQEDKKSKEDKSVSHRMRNVVTPDPSRKETHMNFAQEMEFQASSPDEKALLEACETLGILYTGEREDVLTLNFFGHVEKFKRLMHLEFDAVRKCMSVIVKNEKDEIWLYTKGAESSILPKCDHGPVPETLKHVLDFALMGLRTLVVSEKKLSQSEFDEFSLELRAARRLIKNSQEEMHQVYAKIESNMTVLGATGVEDQLQDNVPATLRAFAKAGIRVWMLTGDKLETGINVAVSCGLINAKTKQYIISQTSCAKDIKQALEQYKEMIASEENTCFVIDGESLAVAFRECAELLRDVAMSALRVVCCRMAPLQKAQVVQMVKSSPNKPTCCAVGDGANDVAMILAAHIGIGILGKEGRQAARSADFALAKFDFLRKAILVHGHFYYVRLANLANFFFYKNLVLVFPQLLFCFYNTFSSQTLFVGIYMMFFNIAFASFPVFIYALMEQPYSAEILIRYPHLYRTITKNALLSIKHFFPWMFSAIWHPTVCFYFTSLAWKNFQHVDNIEAFGTCIFTGIILAVNSKMAIETKSITVLSVLAQIGSYASWFLVSALYSEVSMDPLGISNQEFQHVFFTLVTSANFWCLIWVTYGVAMFPDVALSILRDLIRSKPDERRKRKKKKELKTQT